MSFREFSELDTNGLEQFVAQRIDEGHYIDYKVNVTHPLGTSEKKEFLKDISGFANASGGMIIYGCDEPKASNTWQLQLSGITPGTGLAGDMERVSTSGLDPRIPGINIRTIPLANGQSAIVVYIPPSNIKPHMVSLQGSNKFYMRHSESTDPMTTSEVRNTVLSAYNREEAIEKLRDGIVTQAAVSPNFNPTIILQAIPLTDLSEHWNVYSPQVEAALRGDARNGQFVPQLALRAMHKPTIDVQEVFVESKSDSTSGVWKIGVRTNGHVYLIYKGLPSSEEIEFTPNQPTTHPYFSPFYNQIFCSFGAIVDELLDQTGSAHGYRICCELHHVGNLTLHRFQHEGGSANYFGPLVRKELQWPPRNIAPGGSIEEACSTMGETIYQAFHVLPRHDELKVRGNTG